MFSGYYTALVTPFQGDRVDEAAFRDLVDWQIAEGISGLVPCGTTGESPTLAGPERRKLVELCIKAAGGRVPVMAGTGSNATTQTIANTQEAKEAGAQAALVVTPYYNKPNQEGLYAHFAAIADAVEIPIFIYNIPGRSIVDMSVATMARLARHPNIVGVKDATGDVTRVTQQRLACGPDFIQFSGEDASALGHMAHGGVGCISVASNVAPRLSSEFGRLALAGDFGAACAIQDQLQPLHDALFSSTSPGPTKYALARLGRCAPDLRLPVTPPDTASKAQVDAALAALALEAVT